MAGFLFSETSSNTELKKIISDLQYQEAISDNFFEDKLTILNLQQRFIPKAKTIDYQIWLSQLVRKLNIT